MLLICQSYVLETLVDIVVALFGIPKKLDGTTKSHGLENETTEFLKSTLTQGRVWLG